MSPRFTRVSRWIVPAAGILAATSGVVVLILGEVVEATPPAKVHVVMAMPEAPPANRRRLAPSRGVVPAASAPRATATDSRPTLVQVTETPAVLAASPYVVALAVAPTLDERLRRVEELVRDLPPMDAAQALLGLLDARLPGDAYEEEALRLAVLARLGEFPGPAVDGALVARLAPERSRSERLLAMSALANRPYLGRPELAHIAANDHDTVVRRQAERVLARSR